MRKLLLICALLFSATLSSLGQCTPPTNFQMNYTSIDSIHVSWTSSLDSFQIEYQKKGFAQGTGNFATVHDTSAVFGSKGLLLAPYYKPVLNCTDYDVYIRGFCTNGSVSSWGGPFLIHTPKLSRIIPDYTFELNWSQCGDSISPDTGGFKFDYILDPVPNNLPATFSRITNSIGGVQLLAAGIKDTITSYTTPWIDFGTGTKDVVFFMYSNNITNPGDNVTLTVKLTDGVNNYNSIFSYAGDHPGWKKTFIDLAPYSTGTSDSIRLTFEVDQTTASLPQNNDFVLDEVYVGDTTTFNSNEVFDYSRPLPTDVLIKRLAKTGTEISFQYGPAGFTPNNGQFGAITTTSDSIYFSNVPMGTEWIYVKDTSTNTLELHKFSKWQGPYSIDSTYHFLIQGRVAQDFDNNCVLDSSEPKKYIHGYFESSQKIIFTNYLGYFETLVNPGKYKVVFSGGSHLNPCHKDTLFYDTDSLPSLNQNLLKDGYWIKDLRPRITNPYNIIQGETKPLHFKITNFSIQTTDSIHIILSLPTGIHEAISTPGWTTIDPTGVYYKKIAPIQGLTTYVDSTVQVQAKLGTALIEKTTFLTIGISGAGYPESGWYLTNNTHNYSITNYSAVDPNDKQVTPRGHTVLQDSVLYYRIRFQNTGSFPAAKVVVVDTLPSYLHNADFELIETSHNCQTEIDSNHVAKFTFYNIQLPDSTTDLEGSQGYIDYAVILDLPMQIGDSVSSRAHIYFDYQPAVITNDAWVKVIDSCDLILPEASFVHTVIGLNAQGFDVDFTSTAKNAKHVYWDFGDGKKDTGTAVSHRYTSNNNFVVTQTIENNCGDLDSATNSFTVNGIGMAEFINGGLKVFPNPAKNSIAIECTSHEKMNMQLIDVSGRVVLQETMTGGKHILNLNSVSAGNYILQLLSTDNKLIGKEKIQVVE